MTWTAFHRRGEILRDLTTLAAQRRDGRIPRQLPDGTEPIPGAFRDELDLLAALLLAWHTALSGNLERELAAAPADLEGAVVRAWSRTAGDNPGIRLVLDHYAAHPADRPMAEALMRARHKEWVRLAAAAGRSSDEGLAAAEAGRRIELAARAVRSATSSGPGPDEVVVSTTPSDGSLVDRIRAALPA